MYFKNQKDHMKFIGIILYIISYFFIPSSNSFANTRETPEVTLEKHLDQLISRYIDQSQYSVKVKLELEESSENKSLPYMPNNKSSRSLNETPRSIAQNAKAVNIQIFTSRSNIKEIGSSLEEIIITDLGLPESSKSVKYKAIKTPPLDKEAKNKELAQRQQALLEGKLREEKRIIESLREEKNQITQKLTLVERDLEKLERATKGENSANNTPADSQSELIDRLINSPIIPSAAIIIAIIIFGLFINKAAKNGAKQVQAGIEKLASNISSLNQGQSEEALTVSSTGVNSPGHPRIGDEGHHSLSEVHNRMKEIHKNLMKKLQDETEDTQKIIQAYISSLLDTAKGIEVAACTMEFLGADHANKVYSQLNQRHQNMILQFINHGTYSIDKSEIMLKTAELINTKILSTGMSSTLKVLDQKIENILLQITQTDLPKLTEHLSKNLLTRFFCYLEPQIIANIINESKSQNTENLQKTLDAFQNLHQQVQDTTLDKELFSSIEQWQKEEEANRESSYFNLYQEVVENIDDDLSDKVLTQLSQIGETTQKFLQKNIITFNTFFKLATEYQEEILDSLSMQFTASLILNLKNSQLEEFKSLLDKEQLNVLADEVKQLEQQNSKKNAILFQKAKTKIKQDIQKIAANSLSEILREESKNESKQFNNNGGMAA